MSETPTLTITAWSNGWLNVGLEGRLLRRDGTTGGYAYLGWPVDYRSDYDPLPEWVVPIVDHWRPLLLALLRADS